MSWRRQIVCLLLLTSACRPAEDPDHRPIPAKTHFFDLAGFVDSLTTAYTEGGVTANKRVRLGDKTESQKNIAIDWADEFRIIKESRIDRSAWREKFTVDSLPGEEKSLHVLYLSDAADVPVKELEVAVDREGKVSSIRIVTAHRNLLFKSRQEIHLEPGKGYSVEGTQRALIMKKTDFSVEAHLLINQNP